MYNGIIENKLRIIEEKVDTINNWKVESLKDLKKDTMLHLAVERALQIAIEAMIDVAERILAIKNIPPQNSSAQSLEKLQKLNILEYEKDYTDMIRFRNFIVHRYEHIDLDVIFNIVTNKLYLFTKFVDEIRKS